MKVPPLPLPVRFAALMFWIWVQRREQDVIDYVMEENRLLRSKFGKQRLRFSDEERRRLAIKGKRLGLNGLRKFACIVTPETILGWYRKLIARKYTPRGKRRGPGRPSTAQRIVELVVWIASENIGFGYTRTRDAVGNLGHEIGRSTVKRILEDHGIVPAPERRKKIPWKTFLGAHSVAAADFFTVEVLTLFGLVRYHVLFVIDLKTRCVEIAGITCDPHGEWMKQMARNLTDIYDGFLRSKRFLILDRDPLFTADFRRMLEDCGTEILRLPARSPNLNAFAERFVLSIRSECLDWIVPCGEKHLRRAVAEYMVHYHRERNHQGLNSRLIKPYSTVGRAKGEVACRKRLGGVLRYYYRKAA